MVFDFRLSYDMLSLSPPPPKLVSNTLTPPLVSSIYFAEFYNNRKILSRKYNRKGQLLLMTVLVALCFNDLYHPLQIFFCHHSSGGKAETASKEVFTYTSAAHRTFPEDRLEMHRLPYRAGLYVFFFECKPDSLSVCTECCGINQYYSEPSCRAAVWGFGHKLHSRKILQTLKSPVGDRTHRWKQTNISRPAPAALFIEVSGVCQEYYIIRNNVPKVLLP